MNAPARKVMIVAGEPSGDMHAAALIKALRTNKAGARFDARFQETRPAVQDAERVAAVVTEASDRLRR